MNVTIPCLPQPSPQLNPHGHTEITAVLRRTSTGFHNFQPRAQEVITI